MEVDRDSAQTTLCDEEKLKDLFDVDSEERELPTYPTRSRLCRTAIIALSVIIILTTILYFMISRSTVSGPRYDQCGTTAAEARSKGCVFETTGFAWLPPECLDPITENEFLEFIDSNDLKLYRDMNYTEEVPIEEVRRGDGPGFYVRQQYHLTHCLFLIKKLHRALTFGKMVDGLIKPLHHTGHCVGQLLHPPGFRKDDVQLSYTKFPYCGRSGGYNLEWPDQGTWTNH